MKNYIKYHAKFLMIVYSHGSGDNVIFSWNLASLKREFFNTYPAEDWSLDRIEEFKQALIKVAEDSNKQDLVRELKLEDILK